MNDDIKRLRTLVDTYKLSRPVSPGLQKFAIKSRTPTLKRILKKSGKYGLVTWLVIMIFTLFRKYGIHITMIQSKIIAGVTAAAVASGSAAVAYRGVTYIIGTEGRPASQVEETVKEAGSVEKIPIEEPGPAAPPSLPAEKKRIEQVRPVPVQKKEASPENKLPEKDTQKKGAKKTGEHNTVSDIPSL